MSPRPREREAFVSEQYRQDHGISPQGAVVCLTLLGVVLVYSFRLTSFLLAKEATLVLGLSGVAVAALSHQAFPRRGLRAFAPLWALLGASAVFRLALARCHVPSDAVVELVRWASLLLFGAYAYDILQNEEWRRRLRAAIGVSATMAALLGLVQYLNLAPSLFPSFGEQTQRMYSVFGNQDLLGGYLAMAVPILVHGFLAGSPRSAFASLMALAVVLSGLLLSGSRTAWLAAAVGVLVVVLLGVKSRRRIVALGAVVAGVLLAVVLLAPESTTQRLLITLTEQDVGGRARLWFWEGTLRMIWANPWAGVGPGNYAYWSPQYLGEVLHAPGGEGHYHNLIHTLHAHCEPLNWSPRPASQASRAGSGCW